MGQILSEVTEMTNEVITIQEAVVATTLERISTKVNERPWIEVLMDWQRSGQTIPSEPMKAVYAVLAPEKLPT